MIKKYSTAKIAGITEDYINAMQKFKTMPFEEFKKTIEDFVAQQNADVPFALDVSIKNTPMVALLLTETGLDFDKKLQYVLDNERREFFSTTLEGIMGKLQDSGKKITDSAKAILEKNGYIFDVGSFGYKREQFTWEGFTVANAGFTSKDSMQGILKDLKPQVDRMRKLGLGQVLYGPLVIMHGEIFGQVLDAMGKQYKDVDAAALYDIKRDSVYLDKNDIFLQESSFSHELGHRHYYKVLSPSQRQRWQAHFKNRTVEINRQDVADLYEMMASCAPKFKDHTGQESVLWDQFNWAKFLQKLHRSPRLEEIVDALTRKAYYGRQESNIKTARRKFIENDLLEIGSFGGIHSCAFYLQKFSSALETNNVMDPVILNKAIHLGDANESNPKDIVESAFYYCRSTVNNFLRTLTSRFEGNIIGVSHSTTEYGKNNPSEDYAEAFMAYIMNYEMPPDILQEFVAMNKIRLAKKAKKHD